VPTFPKQTPCGHSYRGGVDGRREEGGGTFHEMRFFFSFCSMYVPAMLTVLTVTRIQMNPDAR
jgi:hypothetical protein